MENTRTSIWANIMDSIKAFASTEVDNNGKINEDRLTSEEKKELAKLREMDQVEKLEGRANLRKKYGTTVDSSEAKAKARANKAEKEQEDKTISSK